MGPCLSLRRRWNVQLEKKGTYLGFSITPAQRCYFPIGEHSSYRTCHRDDIKSGLTLIGLIFRMLVNMQGSEDPGSSVETVLP